MDKKDLENLILEVRAWVQNWPDKGDKKACFRHLARHDQLDAALRDVIENEENAADWWKAGEQ